MAKNNMHHAYLLEGRSEDTLLQVIAMLEENGFDAQFSLETNPDIQKITVDTFKMEDAKYLKSLVAERAQSGEGKVFIISANSFLLEAQNSLLKIFEEPTGDSVFFLSVLDTHSLIKTLVSRFHIVSARLSLAGDTENIRHAEKFIKSPISARIEFLKELVAKDEESDEDRSADSARSRAHKFLNSLETALHTKMSKGVFDISVFHQIFKVRKYLRQSGSSVKTLMESLALIVPNF